MTIATFSGTSSRQKLSGLLLDGNTVANYQPGVGVTGALNASAWANQIGAAGSLAQGTGANQPIYLPWVGTNYAYLPGVSGNFFNTPHSASIANLTDFTVIVKVALNDYTPSADQMLMAKQGAIGTRTFSFLVDSSTPGQLVAVISGDGNFASVSSTTTVGLTDGSIGYLAMTRQSSDGAVKFWKSTDNINYTQVGTTQTGATGALYNNAAIPLEVGATFGGTAANSTGKFYWAKLYTGVVTDLSAGTGGTLVKEWTGTDWEETTTNGATQASSTTGETWTLNCTGSKPAQIVASPQLLADGAAHKMATAAASIVQPVYGWIVVKPLTYTAGDWLLSGTTGAAGIIATTGTPAISVNAGSNAAENAGATLNAYHVVEYCINGASSYISVDGAAQTTGNAGAGEPDGLSLFSDNAGANYGNYQVKEWIVRSAAQAQIQPLLKAIHGTP